jgi:hypothetical protein
MIAGLDSGHRKPDLYNPSSNASFKAFLSFRVKQPSQRLMIQPVT